MTANGYNSLCMNIQPEKTTGLRDDQEFYTRQPRLYLYVSHVKGSNFFLAIAIVLYATQSGCSSGIAFLKCESESRRRHEILSEF